MDIEKKIIFLMLIVGFLLIQNVILVSSQSCISELKIELIVYERQKSLEGEIYKESSYQPTGIDEFVREGDRIFIETLYAKRDLSCEENGQDSIKIQFKRPASEIWGEDLNIDLNFTDNLEYSFELVDKVNPGSKERYIDSYGRSLKIPPKTLNEEGVWEIRLVYQGEELENFHFLNQGFIIPKQINVLDRVDVTVLEINRKLLDRSDFSIYVMILVAIASIIVMYVVGTKQLKKMDKHHKEKIKLDGDREEEKQLDLLRTMMTELTFLEKNLNSYKETFSKKSHYPFYELWDIDAALYLRELNYKIKGKETIKLKENLMTLKDKLLIINNMKLESKRDEEQRGDEKLIQVKIESIRKGIVKIIDSDILPVLIRSKKFIKNLGV